MITRQEYSNLVSGKNQRAEHYRGSVNALCTPITVFLPLTMTTHLRIPLRATLLAIEFEDDGVRK